MSNHEVAQRIVSDVFGIEVIAKDSAHVPVADLATEIFNRVVTKSIEHILDENYPEGKHAAANRLQS